MKTQTYVLIGLLALSFVVAGAFLFQQSKSSEPETAPISKDNKSQSQKTVSFETQKTATEEPVSVTGEISVSFE